MDNLYDPMTGWALYLGFALLGCWCWRMMFYWMSSASVLRDLLVVLGPVLVLSPAKISPDSDYFAPAFMVAGFSAFSNETEITDNALIWWLVGLLVGILYVLVRWIIRLRHPAAKPVAKSGVKSGATSSTSATSKNARREPVV
jgi:hypothetical protein